MSRRRGPVPVIVRHQTEEHHHQHSPAKHRSRSHRTRTSSSRTSTPSSKYFLTFMAPLPSQIPTHYPFQPAVLITKRSSSTSTSRLIATTSLIPSDRPHQYHTPSLQGGVVSCPSELPSSYRSQLPPHLAHSAIGYASFPDISIARPGWYKVRVTLVRMPRHGSCSREAETVAVVESGEVEVYEHPGFRGSII